MPRVRSDDYGTKSHAILDSAAALFAKEGYPSAKMQDIAKACGATKSMLYHYFPTKDDLLFAMLMEHLERVVHSVEDAIALHVPPRDKLQAMVRQIRDVEAALGSPIKAPTESEIPVRAVVRRSVTAGRDLAVGETLVEADLMLLRPASGIPAKQLDDVVGRVVKTPVAAGQPLQWADLA